MTPAAFAGTYSDLKLVKTRSVAVVHIEIPIEQAKDFVAVFGMPLPGSERPVALALLNASPGAETPSASPDTGQQRGEPGKPQTPRKHWSEMSRAQQAGILCCEFGFGKWLMGRTSFTSDDVAQSLRNRLGIGSRADIDDNPEAARAFDAIVSRYRMDTGQMAEQR